FGSRDYGQREDRDAWQRQYGSPYSRSSSYEDPYDSPRQRSGYDLGGRGYGGRSSGNWPEQGFEHQRSGQGQGEFGYGRRQQARGPKGYKRSDDRIREDVCDRLSQSWDLDASEVEVTVSNGEVTLTGTINDRDQKFRAESIADAVGGVNEVHNQLRVRRESTAQTNRETSTQATKPSATNPRSS
ncbi:MAG TPA: BON domain-containing protein, partial [Polyangiales bacterium]|nr:BON domain-containing protein [Polyangiales bacterium]